VGRASLDPHKHVSTMVMERLKDLLSRVPQMSGGGGGGNLMKGLGLAGAAATGIAYGGSECIFNVEGGHRAVMFHRFGGVQRTVRAEGTHLMVPWFQRPVLYDVRTKPRMIQSMTGSKDLQMVNISLRVLSRPDVEHLPQIFQELGTDYDERVLPSIVNEVLKTIVAQYNAAQLITMREAVSRKIRAMLVQRAQDFHIVLDDVSITHLSFGKEYTAAIEAKQVAQQDAERARFVVDKARQEKRSLVIKAEGEAKSAQLIGDAIRDNPGYIQLRKLEAARDIAGTLSKSANRVFLSSNSLLLNVQDRDTLDLAGRPSAVAAVAEVVAAPVVAVEPVNVSAAPVAVAAVAAAVA